MQNAEAVLNVLSDRGRRGLPVIELYRQLFNPALYELAYGRIYANDGAMTPGGPDGETADGMSWAKIGRIIDALRHERFRFQPCRRVYIPKANGKLRPLGLPPWSDKFVGEVIRILLEAYYEPQFADQSHGFRPGRGCHTALREIGNTWKGTSWFIEGDISDCFGSLDHEVLVGILSERIRDNRFLRLIMQMLKAGYLEDWKWNATLSGAPQGGVISPILSNIYLDRLDRFIVEDLIPRYTRGKRRAANPVYHKVSKLIGRARIRGDHAALRTLHRRQRELPSQDCSDSGYRRLRYCRYADDHLLGFTGPRAEAEEIKDELKRFLHDELKLELNEKKTLITHARTQPAAFLGYEIIVQHSPHRRSVNGVIGLRVPRTKINAYCSRYLMRGKPVHRPELLNLSDRQIIATYGSEYRGIVQYYLLAGNVCRLNRLEWVAATSMLKTLAAKHRSTVSKMAGAHKAKVSTPHGLRTCFEATEQRLGRKPLIGRFGGIPLKEQRLAVVADQKPSPYPQRKELLTRLQAERCELCRASGKVEVHQIRNLAALSGPTQPPWAQKMTAMRRKTLIVCGSCHATIHGPTPTRHDRELALESLVH